MITLPAWFWLVSCLPLPWEKLEGETVSLPSPSATFFFFYKLLFWWGGSRSSLQPPPPPSLQTYCLNTVVVST